MQEEKRSLEEKLEAGGSHGNEEERDKAAIMASERKARAQVSLLLSCIIMGQLLCAFW